MKDKLLEIFANNRGIILGGIVGGLVFFLGITKILTLFFLIFIGMVIGSTVEKNSTDIKETLKSFIDKL